LALVVVALLSTAASGEAAQCGSALLIETAAPAVFDGLSPAEPVTARFWEAGAAGANRGLSGCRAGCTNATGSQCAGGGDCLALTGVSWLNATCSVAGHLPPRTVFLVEQTTPGSGGRWAALDLDANAGDANTDLDVKAAAVCGGCASLLSPYLGGSGRPQVTESSLSGNLLTATLAWSVPPPAAQALSNGSQLVTSYGVLYRGHAGTPPPSTGDPSGWVLVPDLEADGVANGGYSTDTTAVVELAVPAGAAAVTFAIGLNFDGTGDPATDPNTVPAVLISDQSEPVVASNLLFADGFESGDTSAWSGVVQ